MSRMHTHRRGAEHHARSLPPHPQGCGGSWPGGPNNRGQVGDSFLAELCTRSTFRVCSSIFLVGCWSPPTLSGWRQPQERDWRSAARRSRAAAWVHREVQSPLPRPAPSASGGDQELLFGFLCATALACDMPIPMPGRNQTPPSWPVGISGPARSGRPAARWRRWRDEAGRVQRNDCVRHATHPDPAPISAVGARKASVPRREGSTASGARCQAVNPTAGHSQPRTGSSGNVATNRPRHSNSSPAALTTATLAAVATTAGSGVAELGRQLAAGGTQRRDEQGRGSQPPGLGSGRAGWRSRARLGSGRVARAGVDSRLSSRRQSPSGCGAAPAGGPGRKQRPHSNRHHYRDRGHQGAGAPAWMSAGPTRDHEGCWPLWRGASACTTASHTPRFHHPLLRGSVTGRQRSVLGTISGHLRRPA